MINKHLTQQKYCKFTEFLKYEFDISCSAELSMRGGFVASGPDYHMTSAAGSQSLLSRQRLGPGSGHYDGDRCHILS